MQKFLDGYARSANDEHSAENCAEIGRVNFF